MERLLSQDEIMQEIPGVLGVEFVPRMFRELQSSPDVLQYAWPMIKGALTKGKLHRVSKELIFVVVSGAKRCLYCHTAHRALAESLGFCTVLLSEMGADLRYLEPAKLRHLLEFAIAVTNGTDANDKDHVGVLIREGYSQEEIREAITTISVANMVSSLANGMAMNDKVDPEFLQIITSKIQD